MANQKRACALALKGERGLYLFRYTVTPIRSGVAYTVTPLHRLKKRLKLTPLHRYTVLSASVSLHRYTVTPFEGSVTRRPLHRYTITPLQKPV